MSLTVSPSLTFVSSLAGPCGAELPELPELPELKNALLELCASAAGTLTMLAKVAAATAAPTKRDARERDGVWKRGDMAGGSSFLHEGLVFPRNSIKQPPYKLA